MIVIGRLELVLDDDSPSRPGVAGEGIQRERPDRSLPGLDLEGDLELEPEHFNAEPQP